MTFSALAFVDLWIKFQRSSAWIAAGYQKRGWNDRPRTFDPAFETDIKAFEDKVQKPMDAAWSELNEQERKEAECECERRGNRIKP